MQCDTQTGRYKNVTATHLISWTNFTMLMGKRNDKL